MRLLPALATLLLLTAGACTSADMNDEPSCDDGSCDDRAEPALVEFCRVDVGLTWDCEDITSAVNLCDYDGNYRIGGGVVQLHETDGSVCNINALTTCHALHVSESGEYLVCELGSIDLPIGFDGVPLMEGGLEVCGDLETWEGYTGYFHDRKFAIGREGAVCRVTTEAFAIPEDSISCHEVVISQEGMSCRVGDFNEPTLYPFVE